MKPLIFCADSVRAWQAGRKTCTRRVIADKVWKRLIEYSPEHYAPETCRITGVTAGETLEWEWKSYALNDDAKLSPDAQELKRFLWTLPPYRPGEVVWIREPLVKANGMFAAYQADDDLVMLPPYPDETDLSEANAFGWQPQTWDWKRDRLPAMFCPRWAARHFARIPTVRAERLQDISLEDVISEGVAPPSNEDWETFWFDHDPDDWECGRCGGEGFVEYADSDDLWGEDSPSRVNHLLICPDCAQTAYWKTYELMRGKYATWWDELHGDGAWSENPWVWRYGLEQAGLEQAGLWPLGER